MITHKKNIISLLGKITWAFLVILSINSCNLPRRALITLIPVNRTNRNNTASAPRSRTYEPRASKTTNAYSERNRRSSGNTSSTFDVNYKSILDKETSYNWEPHMDNPTSMYRFLMEENSYSKRIPRFNELIYFFEKISAELRSNPNGEVAGQAWLQTNGNYISATEMYDEENNKFYRGIRWNYSSKNFETVNLAPGDLVYIVLISMQ